MKKEIFFPVIKFWAYFVIIPFFIAVLLGKFGINSIAGLIGNYVILVAPVLFFVFPFQEIKKYTKKLIQAVLFSLVIPYAIIYIILVLGLLSALRQAEFPI